MSHHDSTNHQNYPYIDYQDGSAQNITGKSKTKMTSGYKESPVKAACLTCRAKKAKCDGQRPVCGACEKKSLDCQYVKSRRGGARKKREVVPPSALQEFLKKLDGLLGIPDFKVQIGKREPSDDTTNIVREFSSREEIFNCYYNDVHPFVPVMPPRKFLKDILPTLLPVSPFLLAAQTILVLVPHPLDPDPKSANSKRLRSAASHAFAAEATQAVERLVETGNTSLECVQALTILALWEWGSSGSTTKNRARSGHATQLAMEIGLHDMDKYVESGSKFALEGVDWRKDMARRTWWQTYVNQLSSAVITGMAPVMSPDDERVHVCIPIATPEDRAWSQWIETNKQCTRVFNIVNSIYYGHLQPGGGAAAWGGRVEEVSLDQKAKMKNDVLEVDQDVTEMMRKAEQTAIIELVPGGEEEVVRNLQLSSRLGLAVVHIHIHRHQAFPEVSLFSKMICGLPKMPSVEEFISQPETASLQQIQGSSPATDPSPRSVDEDAPYDFIDDMWQPETFPESLPEPWFTHPGGAGALYAPTHDSPTFYPPVAASIASYHSPEVSSERRTSIVSVSSNKPHKAWGVDANDKPDAKISPAAPNPEMTNQLFPPGVSLARCATAAHTIVRLEVLHRSAVIAMWDGPPKWMPFCACGLVTGAYSFLLLALAVQAESLYNKPTEAALEQIDGLLTNVKVIVAGLEAYGTMWSGIEVMASEVRAALDAATQLPFEIRRQLDIAKANESQYQVGYHSGDHADDSMRFTHLSPGSGYGRENSVPASVSSVPGVYGYTGPEADLYQNGYTLTQTSGNGERQEITNGNGQGHANGISYPQDQNGSWGVYGQTGQLDHGTQHNGGIRGWSG